MPAPASIGQIAVVCHDIGRATAFYRDVIGLPLLFEAGGMSFLQCGEVRLMLSLPSAPEFDHPGSVIYFRVEGIEARMEALRAKGAEILRDAALAHSDGRHALWLGFFKDTEGNTLALMEERILT